MGESSPAYQKWRDWVTKHPVAGAAIAGLAAVQFMTLFAYYLRGIGLPNLQWPDFNGSVLSVGAEKFGSSGSFFAGQSLHMADGVVFAILFALFFSAAPPLSMLKGNLAKAMGFSTMLALISMGFLIPYVYLPHSGFGFFSFYGANHWKLPLSVLLNHWEYGLILGLFYNPRTS